METKSTNQKLMALSTLIEIEATSVQDGIDKTIQLIGLGQFEQAKKVLPRTTDLADYIERYNTVLKEMGEQS